MAEFEWGNGTIRISPATGRTRMAYWWFKDVADVYTMPEGLEKSHYDSILGLLARVEAVEDLLIRWNSAIIASRAGGNDPDLLPPDDLSAEKKDPPESKQNGNTNKSD
jgi:hypothetical protein